ncbi:TIGR02302 family protein [Defluviimonas aestuarii]|uniref:TIGR02302 family protein n=1 Tax=Albidovulum aestuarii TaxID=1130726 RepID=UPI0030149082
MRKVRALPHEALRRLRWPVRITRAGMAAERITKGFWPVWTILFTVIAALALGLHDTLPVEAVWIGGVLALGGLGWALVRGIRDFRWPTRAEALERLDLTMPGRPIAALQDSLALGHEDKGSAAVWRAHVARMAERAVGAKPPVPDLRVSRRDRFALRYAALTAFVIALLFGSLWRVAEVPALARPGKAVDVAGGPSWEGWAEPPPYTGLPSLYLNTITDETIHLPEGTRITLRLYGAAADLAVEETVSGRVPEPAPDDAGVEPAALDTVRAVEFEAVANGRLTISGEGGRAWNVTILPDEPPVVEIAGRIMKEADGRMTQPFIAKDDYAVTSGRAVIELDFEAIDRRYGLSADPEARDALAYDLPMPISGDRKEFSEALVEDASKHPFANLPVRMTFEVTDGRNQTGRSATESILLPGRTFFDPVAASLIELRRDLLWTRDNGRRTSQVLHALTHKPEGLLRNERAFLMIRVAMRRLDAALGQGRLSPEMRDELAEALWNIAELIEDGGLADALERMRQAQERLSEAIRRGASPDEIQQLMDELRQATDDYIRKLAENMERQGTDEPGQQQAENNQQITGDQIQQMMDEIQRLMEEGRMAEAQELLEQFNRMMENLRVTEGQNGEGQQGPGGKAMQGLRQTLRDQQGLSDEAFRRLQEQFGQQGEGQQQGQDGQQGQNQSGQQDGESGEGDDPNGMGRGDGTGRDGLAERQQALREMLRRQEEGLPGLPSEDGGATQRSLDRAGRSMDGAEQALRDGNLADALERQAEAIESLREGLRSLGEALAQNQSQQPGGQGETFGATGPDAMRDPLGRTSRTFDPEIRGRGYIGEDGDVYGRARELMDEIRRRSGEQSRPPGELDYLKRLMDRF